MLPQPLTPSCKNTGTPPSHPPLKTARGGVGANPAYTVEPHVDNEFGACPYMSSYGHSSSVVVCGSEDPVWVIDVVAKTTPPDTAKSQHGNSHHQLCTFQALVLLSLRVQFLIETVDVSHQVSIRALDVDGLPVADFAVELLGQRVDAERHVGNDGGLLRELLHRLVSLSCCGRMVCRHAL